MAYFPWDEIGNEVQVEGVIIGDGVHGRYALFLPGEDSENPEIELKAFSLKDWHEWLGKSDDPTFELYEDETRGIVKAVVRKVTRNVDQHVAWAVYRRDKFACRYCYVTDQPLTYDHWLAQAFGGPTTIENGRAACRKCNKLKSNKTIAEWLQFMGDRGLEGASTAERPTPL